MPEINFDHHPQFFIATILAWKPLKILFSRALRIAADTEPSLREQSEL